MIVSIIYKNKKKLLKIDKYESILSIKNKIDEKIFKKEQLDNIQLFYNNKILKNEDYADKLLMNDKSRINLYLKKRGGGKKKKGGILYYIGCALFILLPLFLIPNGFTVYTSLIISRSIESIKNTINKYIICTLKSKTLAKRLTTIVGLLKYFILIFITYVIITMSFVVACVLSKGMSVYDKPKKICTPVYVGSTAGLIFTSIFALLFFLFRFNSYIFNTLIYFSKKTFITNIFSGLFQLISNIINSIKFTLSYAMPFFGTATFIQHKAIDASFPVLVTLFETISSFGCQELTENKIKSAFKKNIEKINNESTKNNNQNNKNNQNNNNDNNDNNDNNNNTQALLINNNFLNIQYKNGVIDNQGLDEELNKLRDEIKVIKDPICETQDTQCCNPKNLKLIGDSLYSSIMGSNSNPLITIMKNMGFYLGVILAIQEIYTLYMNKNTELEKNIDFDKKDIPEKKLYIKYLKENYREYFDEKIIIEINKGLNNIHENNEGLNQLFKKVKETLNSSNNNDKSEKNIEEVKLKIKNLEDEAIKFSKEEDSSYEPGDTKTKKLLKIILYNSLCNILAFNESGQIMIKEAGGINEVMDIIKSSSAAGSIISFFYIITVIILILCGFFGVF